MTCAEFQRVLPYIIDSGGNSEEESHLKGCPVCSDLVADLKYIADQAKLLVPMEDPNPSVWSGIQSALEREGLVRSRTERFRPLTVVPAAARSPWRFVAPLGALAALAVIALVLLLRTPAPAPGHEATLQPATNATLVDADDEQVIAAVTKLHPKRAESFKRDLNDVNSYISDAKHNVDQNPDDAEARDSLVHAYEQKALLYDVATSRSME
jgi:hypothetical protein